MDPWFRGYGEGFAIALNIQSPERASKDEPEGMRPRDLAEFCGEMAEKKRREAQYWEDAQHKLTQLADMLFW
jgi:hypothetical protein